MRLFVAIDVPAGDRAAWRALRTPDALPARWTDPSQYHVTLRFVGDVDADAAARYADALRTVEAPPARCVPYGLDVLPHPRSPRVLVVGLERTDALLAVYRAVSAALEGAGLEPDERSFRPHVTLARLDDASPEAAHAYLDAREADIPAFRAPAFHLYESILTDAGARHERRATIPLDGP
jgi:2'-5' RNA ligase